MESGNWLDCVKSIPDFTISARSTRKVCHLPGLQQSDIATGHSEHSPFGATWPFGHSRSTESHRKILIIQLLGLTLSRNFTHAFQALPAVESQVVHTAYMTDTTKKIALESHFRLSHDAIYIVNTGFPQIGFTRWAARMLVENTNSTLSSSRARSDEGKEDSKKTKGTYDYHLFLCLIDHFAPILSV